VTFSGVFGGVTLVPFLMEVTDFFLDTVLPLFLVVDIPLMVTCYDCSDTTDALFYSLCSVLILIAALLGCSMMFVCCYTCILPFGGRYSSLMMSWGNPQW